LTTTPRFNPFTVLPDDDTGKVVAALRWTSKDEERPVVLIYNNSILLMAKGDRVTARWIRNSR